VLELFADVFLISLDLPVHPIADGPEFLTPFVTRWFDPSPGSLKAKVSLV